MKPLASGAVVIGVNSSNPILKFSNFSLRCDRLDPQIVFQTPWNWEIGEHKRISVITKNSYLRSQLIASIADLVIPVSGEIISDAVMSWPIGTEGGLDKKLRVCHAVNFLADVYGDCLDQSSVSLNDFWRLLYENEIHPHQIIKELSRSKKDFFNLALSVLFSFDFYLLPRTSYLMSRAAGPLRTLLLEQVKGKSLLSTSTSSRFQKEFCTHGLVLGSLGQILFAGDLSEATQWADQNLGKNDASEIEEDQFDVGFNLVNSEGGPDDQFDM